MKNFKNTKYWKRLAALAFAIILVITMTGSPSERVARAGNEENGGTALQSGKEADSNDASKISTMSEDEKKADNSAADKESGQQVNENEDKVSVQSDTGEQNNTDTQDKPGASTQDAGQTKPDAGTQDGTGGGGTDQTNPDAGTQDSTGGGPTDQTNPDAGTQDGTGGGGTDQTNPDAGTQDGTGGGATDQTKPDAGTQDGTGGGGTDQTKPDAGTQDGAGGGTTNQTKPDAGLQDGTGDSIIGHTKPDTDGADKTQADKQDKTEDSDAKHKDKDKLKKDAAAALKMLPFVNLFAVSPSLNMTNGNGSITIKDGTKSGTITILQKGAVKFDSIPGNSKVTITGTYNAPQIAQSVPDNITVNAPLASAANKGLNITINNLTLHTWASPYDSPASSKSALEVQPGSWINLDVEGTNDIIGRGTKIPGIYVPAGATLAINGTGTLKVQSQAAVLGNTSYAVGAAIGGMWGAQEAPDTGDSGSIIINGAHIIASSQNGGAIGAGFRGIAHNITINGGIIEASVGSGADAAAIGNSGCDSNGSGPVQAKRTSDQHITITGGTISITGNSPLAAAIGGGGYSGGGHIRISGGTISVKSKSKNAIGAGFISKTWEYTDEFTTGSTESPDSPVLVGNAIILMEGIGGSGGFISDKSHQKYWQGIIFEAKSGRVYGFPEYDANVTVPPGYTLTIDEGQGVVAENKNKAINLDLYGTLINRGNVTGNMNMIVESTGRVDNFGTGRSERSIDVKFGGVFNNGSAAEQGKAVLENAPGTTMTVNGTFNNYATVKTTPGRFSLNGTGNIWNLPDIKIGVSIQAAGSSHAASGQGTQEDPLKAAYHDNVSLTASIIGPKPGALGVWTPSAQKKGVMDFKLYNEGETALPKEADIGSTEFSDASQAANATSPAVVVGDRTTIPWEGGKALELKVNVSQAGGGPSSAANTPGVGYLSVPTSAFMQYDKLMPKVTWPAGVTGVMDGDPLSNSTWKGGSADIPGHFAWNNKDQEVKWQPSGYHDYQMDFIPDDWRTYQTATKMMSVKVRPIQRTITYDPQSGNFSGLAPGRVLTAQADNRLPLDPIPKDKLPTRAGSQFVAWYRDKECTQIWDYNKDTVNADMTLYAKYVLINPSLGFVIPTTLALVNDPATGNAQVKGTVKVQSIGTQGNAGVFYPAKVVVTTDKDIRLSNSKGLSRVAEVYIGDGTTPYQAGTPLMTFNFKESPTDSEKYDFWLKMPIDNPERLSSVYNGEMTLTFDTTAQAEPTAP